METIFDHDPTAEELRYLWDLDAESYRLSVSMDRALEDLSMLFAMRDDEEQAHSYARRISDQDYVRFNLLNSDFISPRRAKKRSSVEDSNSKAA